MYSTNYSKRYLRILYEDSTSLRMVPAGLLHDRRTCRANDLGQLGTLPLGFFSLRGFCQGFNEVLLLPRTTAWRGGVCEVLLQNRAVNSHVMCIMPHVSLAWP